MTHLLDASTLIALVVSEHEHHDRASEWFQQASEFGVAHILTTLHDHPAVDFWPDSISYLDVPLPRIRGHRHLTGSTYPCRLVQP